MEFETFYFKTEAEANTARRKWIEAGYTVSLIGLKPGSLEFGDEYVFDVFGTKGRNYK